MLLRIIIITATIIISVQSFPASLSVVWVSVDVYSFHRAEVQTRTVQFETCFSATAALLTLKPGGKKWKNQNAGLTSLLCSKFWRSGDDLVTLIIFPCSPSEVDATLDRGTKKLLKKSSWGSRLLKCCTVCYPTRRRYSENNDVYWSVFALLNHRSLSFMQQRDRETSDIVIKVSDSPKPSPRYCGTNLHDTKMRLLFFLSQTFFLFFSCFLFQ